LQQPFIRGRTTVLSYLLLSLYGFFLDIFGPITPFLKDELSLSYTISSFHFSALALGIIVAGLIAHRLIHKVGRWHALWIGAYGMGAGGLLVALGRSPLVTIAASFLMGLVGTLMLSVIPSLLSDEHGDGRAVALSEANVLASIAGAAAPLLVGIFAATQLGWRAALVVAAVIPIAIRLSFGAVALPTVAIDARPGKASRLPAIYWVYWSGIVLAVSIEFCMIYWSADYLVSVLGMSKPAASRSVSMFLAGMIGGRFAASRLVRRQSPHTVIAWSTLVAGIGFTAFWIAVSPLVAEAGLVLTGFGVAGLYPLSLALSMESAKGNSVQAGSRSTLASGIAIFALPLVLGRIADAIGIQRAFAVILVLVMGVFIINHMTGRYARLKKMVNG